MSDKKLLWMCFHGDFGLVFEVHFGIGCLSGWKTTWNIEEKRRTKICWLGTWNATTWCCSSPDWGLTPGPLDARCHETLLPMSSTWQEGQRQGLSPSKPPTKDVCLAFIEIDRSIAHRSQHLHRSRHTHERAREQKKSGVVSVWPCDPVTKETHTQADFYKTFQTPMLDSLIRCSDFRFSLFAWFPDDFYTFIIFRSQQSVETQEKMLPDCERWVTHRPGTLTVFPNKRCHLIHTASGR